jgi:hypothetical protein
LPFSTVLMTACSRVRQKRASSVFLSNFALCSRPLVQAKIDAIGLVEVSLPF